MAVEPGSWAQGHTDLLWHLGLGAQGQKALMAPVFEV